jgi:hypothetical protein
MVKDFVILTDKPSEACTFCLTVLQAIRLNNADIDIVWYGEGDEREKLISSLLGEKLRPDHCPVGILKGHLFNASRDILYMIEFFKDWEEEGDE